MATGQYKGSGRREMAVHEGEGCNLQLKDAVAAINRVIGSPGHRKTGLACKYLPIELQDPDTIRKIH